MIKCIYKDPDMMHVAESHKCEAPTLTKHYRRRKNEYFYFSITAQDPYGEAINHHLFMVAPTMMYGMTIYYDRLDDFLLDWKIIDPDDWTQEEKQRYRMEEEIINNKIVDADGFDRDPFN